MGFSRQEYWSKLPFPSPGDLPDPRIELLSSALQVDSLPLSHLGSPFAFGNEFTYLGTSLVAQTVKRLPTMWETWVQFLGWEDPLRRAWQPAPVFLPGESPWTVEPGGLQSSKELDVTE